MVVSFFFGCKCCRLYWENDTAKTSRRRTKEATSIGTQRTKIGQRTNQTYIFNFPVLKAFVGEVDIGLTGVVSTIFVNKFISMPPFKSISLLHSYFLIKLHISAIHKFVQCALNIYNS